MEIKVTSCSNCLFGDMNDFCEGYSCKLFKKITKMYSPIIEDDNYYQEIPEWCPLKTERVLVHINNLNNESSTNSNDSK